MVQVRPHHLALLVIVTVALHALQVAYVTSETAESAGGNGRQAASAASWQRLPFTSSDRSGTAVGGRPQLLIATATQPAPCTTAHGDHVIQLSLKNKLQYATLHGYAVWPSTELLSPWDLGGQWNKVALLSVLIEPRRADGGGGAYEGEWVLWMDDDAIICDMGFTFPFAAYDAAGVDLVMWGDDRMTYVDNDSEGINTGIMLLRVSDWTRSLLAEWARIASSAVREKLSNHDQGGLVHLLHHAPERWRAKTLLERNFTMNGHWPEYAGRFVLGARVLRGAVWGSDRPPFIMHFSGCQMCRGHSFNGTWTEAGVEDCRRAFMEAFTYADGAVLERIGMRHLRLGQMGVRPSLGSPLQLRHARLSRCLPSFLVIGTQKGGTSTVHYLLQSRWHKGIAINTGEKEVHYFSFDDNYAKGPTVYQQRWDGADATLGVCPGGGGGGGGGDGRVYPLRGEVSATYLDYPRAAERAAALLPQVRVVALLREPVARVLSSFNMRWQIEVCGRLTWTRPDCHTAVGSREMIRENAVGPFQRAAALKLWSKCASGGALQLECLRADFVAKLRNRTRVEMGAIDECARRSPFEPLGSCLGYRTLSQKKLYKALEDRAFVYRSLYAEHLQGWLAFLPASQLLVLPSEALFDDSTRIGAMGAFATFLGLPASGEQVDAAVLTKPSTASTDGSPHENGRTYVVESAPDDLAAPLRAWLCPRQRALHKLLERHQLTRPLGPGGPSGLPWLRQALAECSRRATAASQQQQQQQQPGTGPRARAAHRTRTPVAASDEDEDEPD